MKMASFKIVVATFVALFTLFVIPQESFAQLSKKQQKQLQKAKNNEFKDKIKEYGKEGWKLSGSSRSLEVALLEHYEKLGQEGNKEFVGEVSQCNSINVCKQFAISNAQNAYASLASSAIKGRVANMVDGNAIGGEEIDRLIAAYEKQVTSDVGGALTESYAIVKENGTSKEYKIFFILNEDKARESRAKAMERSLKETKISIETANEISKFVNEGFNID